MFKHLFNRKPPAGVIRSDPSPASRIRSRACAGTADLLDDHVHAPRPWREQPATGLASCSDGDS